MGRRPHLGCCVDCQQTFDSFSTDKKVVKKIKKWFLFSFKSLAIPDKTDCSNHYQHKVQTFKPGSNPRKGALLKDTRALTLRGKPWLSREGFRRGAEPADSS